MHGGTANSQAYQVLSRCGQPQLHKHQKHKPGILQQHTVAASHHRECPTALAAYDMQMYSPAWRAAEPNPHIANLLFENALKRVCPEAQVIRQAQLDNADFRAFSVPGLYGQDIIE